MSRTGGRAGLKLALVSPYDFAYPGGVTQHVVNLAEQFRAVGHEVHIIAPSSDDEREPALPRDFFVHRIGRVVAIPANGSVARITLSLRAYLQVKRLLHEHHFDLIHLHEPMMPALPLTVLRHSHAVNVGTFHAFRNTPLTYFYGKPILQPFFKKLHGHIAVSNAARDFVGEYFPADYRVIPNGIDFRRFSAPVAPTARFNDGRPNVLFVGRLEKRKGLRFLMRAWRRVQASVPGARLIVVGGGRGLDSYRRFVARRGWSEDMVFVGHVSAEDLPGYYRVATLFCAPSTGQESFGIVLLEAMAAGVPIIASDIPGYRDVVKHGVEGLLVEPEEPEALAVALETLLTSREQRARMAEAGRLKAQQYDWPRVAARVLEYYAEVLERQVLAPQRERVWLTRMRRMAGLLMLRV